MSEDLRRPHAVGMPCFLALVVLLVGPPMVGAGEPERRFEADGYVFTGAPGTPAGTRITVVEKRRSKVVFSATIPELLFAQHYHPIEFRNGRLYVIRRTGGPEGYRRLPETWTDELWRYQGSRGTKLYAARGLDFRVPPGETFVAVSDGSAQQPGAGHLILLSPGGERVRSWHASDLGLEDIGSFWATDSFVFVAPGGPGVGLVRLVRIGARDSGVRTYEFAGLGIDHDYDFDPRSGMIVGSDCVGFVDAESEEAWASERPLVTLFLYDLESATRTTIATSVARPFDPRWIGGGRFEFTDPVSGKRVTRRVGSRRGPGRRSHAPARHARGRRRDPQRPSGDTK